MRLVCSRRNVAVVLLAGIIALGGHGCTRGARSPFEREVTARVTPEKPQFKIDGWTDRAGAHHELKGIVRLSGDSVQLYRRPPMARAGAPEPPPKLVATVPRSDVVEVDVRRFSLLKTGILILVPVVAFYGFLIVAYSSEGG